MQEELEKQEIEDLAPSIEPEIQDDPGKRMSRVAEFMDAGSFIRIINKLTDYAEIIPEGKLAGLVNYSFSFSSTQTNTVIDLLVEMGALSRIYSLALKGSRDLESEYISNIFSDAAHPETISSYMSIRNILENRLNNQIQHYNLNMGKSNSTHAMPIAELKSHMKTYLDLSRSHVTISTKAQHGFIAASLHDAYVTIMNKTDWWNDRTYMKFFFNDDIGKGEPLLIIHRRTRLSLQEIHRVVDKSVTVLEGLRLKRKEESPSNQNTHEEPAQRIPAAGSFENNERSSHNRVFSDRMMSTPFGKQYGNRIDSLIDSIFSLTREEEAKNIPELEIGDSLSVLFEEYNRDPSSITSPRYRKSISRCAGYLLFQDYGVRTIAEKFLYSNRKESFSRFFTGETRERIEEFMTDLFGAIFEDEFSPLFRIIRTSDMKKFTCAFTIKRIYLKLGEALTPSAFLLLKAIGRAGKIRTE